ncbi:unnamed protein product [Arctogadus glacialis]
MRSFFPQCCNRAASGLLVGRWLPCRDTAVVLAVIHYPFIPSTVKQYLQKVQAQSQVPVEVLGSWSMPSEKQEGLDSFLRDLRTIFPQGRWLQVSREVGKTGFSCQLLPLALDVCCCVPPWSRWSDEQTTDGGGRRRRRRRRRRTKKKKRKKKEDLAEGDGTEKEEEAEEEEEERRREEQAEGDGTEKEEEEEEEEEEKDRVIFVHYDQRKVDGVPAPPSGEPSPRRLGGNLRAPTVSSASKCLSSALSAPKLSRGVIQMFWTVGRRRAALS